MRTCRMCHGELIPLYTLKNHPKSVQNLYSVQEDAMAARDDLVITQCVRCGLVQLANEPVPYYKEVIRASGGSDSMRERQAEALRGFIDCFNLRGKRIVEVGYGKGEYLAIMSNLVVATGVGYPVGLPTDRFDAFVCINFLEHSPEPNKFIQAIAGLIKEEGIGMVSVPNLDYELSNSSLFTFMSDHLLYFTSLTLRTILSLNGFEIVSIGHNEQLGVLTAYVRKRKLKSLGSSIDQFVDIIDNLAERLLSKKVAVWGASHHAFSLLADPKIGDRVSYIVDSARFKQDRFSPVSGIAIYAPDQLLKDPVDIIVVMSPEYADEITATIKEKYPGKEILIIKDGKIQNG